MSFDHSWHVAINRCSDDMREKGKDWPRFMYDAKEAFNEVKRLALLFERERTGKLPKIHRQCSMSPAVPIPDNYLTCCLGTKCAECEYLAALDKAEITHEERDTAKAWTCTGHILSSGGDIAGEGFITTVDDRMFWENVYASLSYDPEEDLKEVAP